MIVFAFPGIFAIPSVGDVTFEALEALDEEVSLESDEREELQELEDLDEVLAYDAVIWEALDGGHQRGLLALGGFAHRGVRSSFLCGAYAIWD